MCLSLHIVVYANTEPKANKTQQWLNIHTDFFWKVYSADWNYPVLV